MSAMADRGEIESVKPEGRQRMYWVS
jgi:hypothetical protein